MKRLADSSCWPDDVSELSFLMARLREDGRLDASCARADVHGWTVASEVFVTSAEESPGSMGRLPGNAWARQPHRAAATESATEKTAPTWWSDPSRARVKWWGKSPPRDWQQKRHGKPHREQNRIGVVRGETLRAVSGSPPG